MNRMLLKLLRKLTHNVLRLCDVAEKNTPKTLNLRQIMKAKNNVTVQDKDGNSSKPLLSSFYNCQFSIALKVLYSLTLLKLTMQF